MGMSGDLPHEIWSPDPHNRTHQQRLIKCLLPLVASLQHLAQLDSKLPSPPLLAKGTCCRMSLGMFFWQWGRQIWSGLHKVCLTNEREVGLRKDENNATSVCSCAKSLSCNLEKRHSSIHPSYYLCVYSPALVPVWGLLRVWWDAMQPAPPLYLSSSPPGRPSTPHLSRSSLRRCAATHPVVGTEAAAPPAGQRMQRWQFWLLTFYLSALPCLVCKHGGPHSFHPTVLHCGQGQIPKIQTELWQKEWP